MEPLTKASLNNQIVSMRHIVRKSKVHIINKLSREAKKLKEKKGTEEQISKNKRKAERFVNELMVIKKLNDDVVTKYALQNEVSASTILNSVDITIETRARARLAGHKFITDAVQNFRKKYPDWKCSITDLLNDLGAKYRTKKKKTNEKKTVRVKTETKSKISKNNDKNTDINEFEYIQSESESTSKDDSYETDMNTLEESIQNDETQKENILTLENNTKSEEDQNSDLFSKKAINTKVKEKSLVKCDKSAKLLQAEVSNLEIQMPKLVKTQLVEKSHQQSLSTNKSVEQIDVETNKKLEKRKAELNTSCNIDYKRKKNPIDEVTPICETVDSFFMTTDNKDYMSVFKPPPVVQKDFEEHPRVEYSRPIKKDIFIKGKKVVVGNRNHMGNRRERRLQQTEKPIDTVLHPSWEAKRKQKSLAKFEGKKITFDDQD